MKKLVATLLALLLALSCIPCLAEEAETEILFRGIPWGTSLAQLQRELPLQTPYQASGISSIAYRMYGGDRGNYSAEIAINAMYTSEGLKGIKVAGYDVGRINFNFAYVPQDGKLVKDNECTALYCALYMFAPDNPSAAVDDLINKLSIVYGDVDLTTNGYNVWFGAEGTMVSLNLDGSEIYVKYSFAGGEELLQNAQRALDGVSDTPSDMDTEGL